MRIWYSANEELIHWEWKAKELHSSVRNKNSHPYETGQQRCV